MDLHTQVSDRLNDYILEVEDTVGRQVQIEPFSGATTEGPIIAALNVGPSYPNIDIQYRPLRPLKDQSIEKAIAHELTHALQIYSLRYPIIDAPDDVSSEEVQKAADIMDFIDDIVIDTLIQKRGFPPTTPDHLKTFEHNCEVLEHAENSSSIDAHEEDPIKVEIKFIGDYIYAWGLPRYAVLDELTLGIFKRFTRIFPQVLKHEFKKVRQIKKLMSTYDIFNKNGRTKVIKGSISLWPLDRRIILTPYAG